MTMNRVQFQPGLSMTEFMSGKRESHHIPVMERFAPDAPAPETTDPLTRMAHQLGTQAGRALYKLRKKTVEPVFGIIKRVMGWRQMSMRGLDKANGEWNLVTMAWNIKRMHVLRARQTPSARRGPSASRRRRGPSAQRRSTPRARLAVRAL